MLKVDTLDDTYTGAPFTWPTYWDPDEVAAMLPTPPAADPHAATCAVMAAPFLKWNGTKGGKIRRQHMKRTEVRRVPESSPTSVL